MIDAGIIAITASLFMLFVWYMAVVFTMSVLWARFGRDIKPLNDSLRTIYAYQEYV